MLCHTKWWCALIRILSPFPSLYRKEWIIVHRDISTGLDKCGDRLPEHTNGCVIGCLEYQCYKKVIFHWLFYHILAEIYHIVSKSSTVNDAPTAQEIGESKTIKPAEVRDNMQWPCWPAL